MERHTSSAALIVPPVGSGEPPPPGHVAGETYPRATTVEPAPLPTSTTADVAAASRLFALASRHPLVATVCFLLLITGHDLGSEWINKQVADDDDKMATAAQMNDLSEKFSAKFKILTEDNTQLRTELGSVKALLEQQKNNVDLRVSDLERDKRQQDEYNRSVQDSLVDYRDAIRDLNKRMTAAERAIDKR